MKRTAILTLLTMLFVGTVFGQAPDTLWSRTYGDTSGWQGSYGLGAASDGGFIIGGSSGDPAWLVRTDADGDTLWTTTYGIDGFDNMADRVMQTADGGFFVGGWTGLFPDHQFHLVKTDANGTIEWETVVGGTGDDYCKAICQTEDGGFAAAGSGENNYQVDRYVVRLNADGDTLWTKFIGSPGEMEFPFAITETEDHGLIIAGWLLPSYYIQPFLMKVDSLGNQLWSQVYSLGSGDFYCYDCKPTSDGGYVLTGYWNQYTGSAAFIFKTDRNGNFQWSHIFDDGIGRSVVEAVDGGYVMGGEIGSLTPPAYKSYYIGKVDADGNELWTSAVGGDDLSEAGWDLVNSGDGGYALIGTRYDAITDDGDIYLVRWESEGPPPGVTVTLTPYGTPIQIPASGGSFDFDLEIDNGTTSTYTVDVWIDVTLPGGGNYPIMNRSDLMLVAGGNIARSGLTQNVPGTVIAGDYDYNVYVSNAATWEILAQDSFTFEKVAGDGFVRVENWNLDGWEDDHTPIAEIPIAYALHSAFPNPFNPTTTLSFSIPEAEMVSLKVYDISGAQVATVVDGWRSAGHHDVTFDASGLTSGVYLYKLTAGSFNASGKMTLMK